MRTRRTGWIFSASGRTLFVAAATLLIAVAAHADAVSDAAQILDQSGVQGGLVVHIGLGDGTLTEALRANDRYVVHGLDRDPDTVRTIRERLLASGHKGSVSAAVLGGSSLPYVDNAVNLLVAEGTHGISDAEIDRVLAPLGVAMIRIERTWRRRVKPWPGGIDEWTHYLHDSTNNAVADDTVVGPPRHYQWIGTPHWLRHHDHLSGFSTMVSARGRLFYIVDLGPRWSVQMPARWVLFARDAFSGVILWQRPVETWHNHLWGLKKGPAQIMRRLVAVDDTVYVTPGVGAPVEALDAATGEPRFTFPATDGAEEILVCNGVLYTVVNPELDAYKNLLTDSVSVIRRQSATWKWDEKPRRVIAFDATNGKLRWERTMDIAPGTLAAAADRLYCHDGNSVRCLEAQSGKDLWTSTPIPRWDPMHVLFNPTLVVAGDVVLFAGGEKMDPIRGGDDTMTALSAQTGERLWSAPHPASGYASAEDLFVIDGKVWCGETTSSRSSGVFNGHDLHTGTVDVTFPPDDWQPHMSHHRCHRAKATANFILTSRTGIEFVDFRAKHWTAHHWVRGSCNYGILPCNGLIYAPPHSCGCYPLAKLNSFNALAPASRTQMVPETVPTEDRLDIYPGVTVQPEPNAPSDWPTYRADQRRTGRADTAVPTKLRESWRTTIGGRLSSVVVACGRLYVADIDRHTIHALDAATGRRLWHYASGGRIDSPPTIWQGRAIFGSADGFITCLRTSDGAPVWRFRAAPVDRRLMAHEQLESAWPVHGSVLIREEAGTGRPLVYAVAGRTMWLDGGLRFLRLDARTGDLVSETVLGDTFPGTDRNLQDSIRWPNLPTTMPDILSCDETFVYMRAQPFTLDGKRPEVFTPRDYREQRGETAHLFSPTGFLDDAWWHRTYWLWGRSVIGAAGGWYLATYQAPTARIMVADPDSVYGFGRIPMKATGTPNTYHLYACAKEPEIIDPQPNRPPRKMGMSVYGPVKPTRLTYRWSVGMPCLVRAMTLTDGALFMAGPREVVSEADVYGRYGDPEIQAAMREQMAAFAGARGGVLMAVAPDTGRRLTAYRLDTVPVFDGMAAADSKLFLAGLDGSVICLGATGGTALAAAPDARPGPVPDGKPSFAGTKTHPDFTRLSNILVRDADIGYHIETATGLYGVAVRKLAQPLRGTFTLRTRVKARPGAAPGTMGNAFIVFGTGPEDADLMNCGFRISGQQLYIYQPPLPGTKPVTATAKETIVANRILDMQVSIDTEQARVTFTMNGTTVEAELKPGLDAITHIGYAVSTVDAAFSPIEIVTE